MAVWQDDGDGTKEITGEDPQDILIATYRYDGLNRRIRKLLGTNPAAPNPAYDYYYNESWQLVEVRKDSDTDPYEQFVWDVRYIDAPVVRFRDGNTDGDLTGGTQEGDNTLYYSNDANMNVTGLVDGSDGTVVERVTYDPYGKPKFYDGSWANPSDSSAFDNAILYCGYYFDQESGLYHVRHRPYDFALGRWLSWDLIGYAGGKNLYQAVLSSPVQNRDPLGLIGEKQAIEIFRITMEELLPWAAEKMAGAEEEAKKEDVEDKIEEWEKDPNYIETVAFPPPYPTLPPTVAYGPIMEDTPCANAYMYGARARGDGGIYRGRTEKYYSMDAIGKFLTWVATKGAVIPDYLKESVERDWGRVTTWIQKDPDCCKCSPFRPYIQNEISLFNGMEWTATPADKRLNKYTPPKCFTE